MTKDNNKDEPIVTIKKEPVARDALGRLVKGTKAINPGGKTKEIRQANDELKQALSGEVGVIHDALMFLVKKHNPQAVLYAHQQLYGKVKDIVELQGSTESPLAGIDPVLLAKAFNLLVKK